MTLLVLSVIQLLYICMYDSTITESHTCSAHKCTYMTILILSNICVYAYVHIYV